MAGSLYPLLSSVHSMVSFEIFLSGTFVSTPSCVTFMNLWVYFYIHFMFTACQVLLLSCVPTLCYPINCSTPGFLLLQYLSEFAQTHVHWVGDVTQPSYLLSPIFPPALNLGASASVLAVAIQGWFPLGLTALISLQSKGLSSFLQHHSLKAWILQHSALFVIRLSYIYIKMWYRTVSLPSNVIYIYVYTN